MLIPGLIGSQEKITDQLENWKKTIRHEHVNVKREQLQPKMSGSFSPSSPGTPRSVVISKGVKRNKQNKTNQRPFGLSRVSKKDIKIYFTK